MAMQITASTLAQSAKLANSEAPKQTGKADKAGEGTSPKVDAKAQLNASIVQASMEVSLKSGNESLALLFKSAIEGINDILAPELGPNAIQNAMSQDNSPEGTAGRIVSLSTGMFELFKQQHPGEDEGAVLKNFMATIGKGFEQGFKEATDILKGMGVFGGDIAEGINKTYELVKKGYADFEASMGGGGQATAASGTAA